MSSDTAVDHLDLVPRPVASPNDSEQVEEIELLSSEVTTDDLLQCGHMISHNLKALEMGLVHMMELICGVVKDALEAGIICPILKNAIDVLALTTKHVDAIVTTIDVALRMFYRCIVKTAHWHELPVHLRELQEHNRRFHELWRQNRDFLNRELLPALSGQLYSSQSVFPAVALWVARLTRSEQLFPRLQIWGQLPDFIAGICAALDPIPALLDKVETYTVDLGKRLQVILSNSPPLDAGQTQKIEPALSQVCKSWAPCFRMTRSHVGFIARLDPSTFLPFSIKFP